MTISFRLLLCLVFLPALTPPAFATPAEVLATASRDLDRANLRALRLAIEDLIADFGPRYPHGADYLQRLEKLEQRQREIVTALKGDDAVAAAAAVGLDDGAPSTVAMLVEETEALRAEALLANPLIDFDRLLFVRRKAEKLSDYATLKWVPIEIGMPKNDWSNASLPHDGYDNELAVLSPVRRDGAVTALYRPTGSGYVGEMDLNFDGDRLLFSRTDAINWKIFEIGTDGQGLRQVSQMPDDVDAFDPCYLPDGRIVFGSTASYQSIPCWNGMPQRVSSLYLMNGDGTGVRQLCFDQDHDLYPVVRNDGQIMFNRWDYTGIRHEYLRSLMTMNPDGTGQRAIYGGNSWWPNGIYAARPIPGEPDKFVGIAADYHGLPRMGWLALFDTSKGWSGTDGLVKLIPERDPKFAHEIKERFATNTWPIFLSPYPLSAKYFLVACRPSPDRGWGLYLADVFDNLVRLREEPGYALLEPVPVRATVRPPSIPDRVKLNDPTATAYIDDIYRGEGLKGVPRGTVKRVRIFSYNYGYPGIVGSTRIGIGGPWEAHRILGTVPVESDGSVFFRLPANTPVSLQPLDAEGSAVQVMRSWLTAMPGEKVSCIGCHESNRETPASPHALLPSLAASGSSPAAAGATLAAQRGPVEITPWHGPARGFGFEREVQPVLDRYCIECHNGAKPASGPTLVDLRASKYRPDYEGWPFGKAEPFTLVDAAVDTMRMEKQLDRKGLHKDMLPPGRLRFSPAYEALFALVRRVNIEDDVEFPAPGEFHSDTSRLVQMLRRGHHGVTLDAAAWDRLVTWIDLNAPYHGTWGEVYAIPRNVDKRRAELRALYGGPLDDEIYPENLPAPQFSPGLAIQPVAVHPRPESPPGWPFDATEARRRQAVAGPIERTLDLGDGIEMKLMRVPAGDFVMGDPAGAAADAAPTGAKVERNFWMGACEVTNRQFRQFQREHDSGYARDFQVRQRLPVTSRQTPSLNEPDQPVVRVTWEEAQAFCRWLAQRTGLQVTLPTETQWEYACRAGTDTPLWFGDTDADFSPYANLADRPLYGLGDVRYDDGALVTRAVGSYRPNAWGLYDMHGNAAEWTSSGTNDEKIVRGGSFYDRQDGARSSARLVYPAWRQVHNIGFRIVASEPRARQIALNASR